MYIEDLKTKVDEAFLKNPKMKIYVVDNRSGEDNELGSGYITTYKGHSFCSMEDDLKILEEYFNLGVG